MEIQFLHKNLSETEEAFFNDYVNKKLDSITSLLTKFAPDAALLIISIEKFEKHNAFEVEHLLKLPAKNLVSKEASHSINKAVDLSKDRVISQIKKHMAHLRKDRSHTSLRKATSEIKIETVQ